MRITSTQTAKMVAEAALSPARFRKYTGQQSCKCPASCPATARDNSTKRTCQDSASSGKVSFCARTSGRVAVKVGVAMPDRCATQIPIQRLDNNRLIRQQGVSSRANAGTGSKRELPKQKDLRAKIEVVYSPKLLDYFQDPKCAGELADADIVIRTENPACGDLLVLSLKVSGDVLAAVRFQAKGCVAAIGCAAAMAEMTQGKTLAEARTIRREDILTAVEGLPDASLHASHLAFDALQEALLQVEQHGR